MASSAGDGGEGQRGTAMPWRPLFRPLDTGLILDDNDVKNSDVGYRMPFDGCRLRWLSARSRLFGVGSGRSRLRIRRLKSVGASVSMASVLFVAHRARVASLKAPAASPVQQMPWGEPGLQKILQGTSTDEFDTPLQRSPRYANQEFFTDRRALQ
jgi:hypothetical protein